MWMQQQPQPQPQTQYPYSYSQQQQQQQQQKPTKQPELDASYKRQTDGPVLWFAGPPLNVIPEQKPVHSLSYLEWKKKKQSLGESL